jgi:hypothetical protein
MLGIAHDEVRLVCGCSSMETNFMKLPMNSSCADVASRGSLEVGSECCNRGQVIFIIRQTVGGSPHTLRTSALGGPVP